MSHKLYMMCVFLFYSYNTRTFDTFKKTGIPGPRPYPVLGTMMELFKHGVSIHVTSCVPRLSNVRWDSKTMTLCWHLSAVQIL